MKQIFTLIAIVCIAATANAQNFTENFEGTLSSCYSNTNVSIANPGITSKSASLTNNGTSILATPYLNVVSSVTIQFDYALSGNLTGGKTRIIQVGYQDKTGIFQAFPGSVSVTSTTKVTYNQTFSLTDGTYRIVVKETGNGSNDVVYLDNMTVNAAYHYGTDICNTAPVAQNANYATPFATAYSGDLNSKVSDVNLEAYSAWTVVSQPSNGNVVLNSDGTFTYTPAGGFVGGAVTFTYKVTDNGYDVLTSNTATVTINYPSLASPLPVRIVSFNGSINNHKAEINWSVAENETGNRFEIEKSANGTNFSQAAIVINTNKQGSENYSYTDASFSGSSYYRLKVVNQDGTITYSRTISLKDAIDTKASAVSVQNPVVSSMNFSFIATTTGSYNVNVYNTAGVRISGTQMNMQKGMNATSLSVDNKVVPGIYILEITNGSDKSIAKFVKQ